MKLIEEGTYNGYSILSSHRPFIENILIGNEQVLARMFESHSRLSLMRFELKFPEGFRGDTEIISKFFDSIRFKINNDLARKTVNRGRTIHSEIGYVWVKELSAKEGWHYHIAMFLNYDVYSSFGHPNSENINMFHRISDSWAGALNFSNEQAKGLVHLATSGVKKVEKCSSNYDTLRWLSYLAKLKTKPYGELPKRRLYGTSRR